MSADGRRNAMRSVDQLEARGGTALVPAFEEAVKVLDGRQGDGRSRLGFIVLLTDGEDTSGFTLSERGCEVIRGALGRYPVHTFGLGRAHDPEVLLYCTWPKSLTAPTPSLTTTTSARSPAPSPCASAG
jgi:hypothetical protein